MHPFSQNLPNLYTISKFHNSSPNLPQLQNFQVLQRFQAMQNLNRAPSPSAGFLHNSQILSNLSSRNNANSFSSRLNVVPHISQGNMMSSQNLTGLRQNNNVNLNNDLAGQVSNMVMALKMQNNLQAELYTNQLNQLLEMQKQLDQKMKENQSFLNNNKTVVSTVQKELSSPIKPEAEVMAQSFVKKTLKNQIRALIQFVLHNSGRISDNQIETEKAKYQDNNDLLAIFDELIAKYASTIKTKEEMVKYTVRKAFKFIKNQVKKENRIDSKEASTILCQRYFKNYTGTIPDLEDEEDFLKFILPFRKNSKNKTMNSSFISEVFASNEFRIDYKGFLDDLDEILETDNNAKLERLVNFIEENLKKNKIPDIRKYKRIPWPQVWIVNTKKIATELPVSSSQGSPEDSLKKSKKNFGTTLAQNSESSGSVTGGTAESSPNN